MTAAASPWDLGRASPAAGVACHLTGEPLPPGTACRSVLIPAPEPGPGPGQKPAASPLRRVDVSEAAWGRGLRPDGLFSHWRSHVPDPAEPRREPLDLAGLLDLVERLGEEDGGGHREAFRFVLALLLMRRRMLRLDGTEPVGGRTVWAFTRKEDPAKGPMGRWAAGPTLRVVDPGLTDADAAAVAQQLHEVLGVEAP